MSVEVEAVAVPAKRRKSDVRKRQAVVAVRLLPHEHEQLVEVARRRGVTVAAVLRSALLADLSTEQPTP